jgi:anti-anti-sigma factor
MRVQAVRDGAIVRLSVSDCDVIDNANAADVKAEALRLIEDAPDFVIDLAGVEFLDSAGVSLLVGLFKHARLRGGRARFCGLTPGVRSVLEILQLDRIFELQSDVDASPEPKGSISA